MSSKFYPNGIGGTLGDQLDTCKPLITSGNVWYVSSLIGTDAASPAGQNREKPLATIAQAITNATANDIIVCLQGHTQTLTGTTTFAKALTIIGEGTVSGKPGVSFLMNSAALDLFSFTSSGCELRNIYFPEAVQTCSGNKVNVAATLRVVGCYFECGAKDTGVGVYFAVTGASNTRVDSTTFISTATLRTAQPLAAIKANGGFALNLVELNDVVVSAGTVGFSNYAAIDFASPTAMTLFRVTNLSLLLGADMEVTSAWTGYVNNQLSTGGSRVSAP
jgi:hypothetical protein